MNTLDRDLQKFISDIVHDFQKQGTAMVKKNIRDKELTVSNELLNSIETRVSHQASKFAYTIQLLTTEYARSVESKNKTHRLASVDALVEWVKDKGLQNFKFIPNYDRKIPKLDVAARRIAWGLINGNRSRGKYRRRYNKGVIMSPYLRAWNKHRLEIVTVFARQASDRIFKDITNNMKGGIYV